MAAQQIADSVNEYLAQHKVKETVEVVLNELAQARPDDPFAFMAKAFEAKMAKPAVARLYGREILDSRGNPTVEVDVYATVKGDVKLIARGAAPSGASTGSNEALELRDKENKDRYFGKGVRKACENVCSVLCEAVAGASLTAPLREFDDKLMKADGTELKTNVGGNAITATSFALATASATALDEELYEYFARNYHGADADAAPKFAMPTPLVNILNGGKHAGGKLKIQEFMIMPADALPFQQKLLHITTVYHTLGKLLVSKYGVSAKNLGDEGGFAPLIDTAEEAIAVIEEAITTAGFKVGTDIRLALDCAASEFYSEEKHMYELSEGNWKTTDEMVAFYEKLVKDHPALVSIEDGLAEQDYEGWAKLTAAIGDRVMIVGDDLYTTNTNLIRKGIENKWANALLLKVNQIGTVSEAMDAARMVMADKGQVLVSHRSGETTSAIIADLVVGIGARYIKTGAPARGERVCKYNRLLQIEDDLIAKGLLKY